MSDIELHDREWNDRLQELLDGHVTGSERATFESHVASCARCRAQFSKLKRLDSLLRSKLERPFVGGTFDQQVFARINAMDDQSRARARGRLERELQDNLQTLAAGWRRGLLSVIGGAIAGIALALAFLAWANDAGLARALADVASSGIGTNYAGLAHTFATIIFGAAIGAGVSRLLTATVG
jgi:anti-sigma factor RsiW